MTAPAQGRPGHRLHRAVLTRDLDPPGDEQRAIAHRSDLRFGTDLFLRASIQPPVLQRTARTSLHDLRHNIRARLVRQHPRPPVQLEDCCITPQALPDVDALVKVEAHLDVATAVDLPHLANTRLSLNA